MNKNTPQLWDQLWQTTSSTEKDIFNLINEENGIRWQRIENIVINEFGSFKDIKVIEIGAGVGTNAALMAKRGAKVTILDYSENALNKAHLFFKRNGLAADFINQDALSLSPELLGKYDISMSFGLTEHFRDAQRINMTKTHFDILRKGGIAFISVPNKYNLPYRIYKFAAELTGKWRVGEEYPYSRRELAAICKQIGISEYLFFGDSLISSFNFINPFKIIKKILKSEDKLNISKIKKEKGTFLDQHLSYALVLFGKK